MGSAVESIRSRLETVFSPLRLEVEDDSARHAGHRDAREGGGHFRLRIISAAFEGVTTIDRHRRIYKVLEPMFPGEIHALQIDARAPGESNR